MALPNSVTGLKSEAYLEGMKTVEDMSFSNYIMRSEAYLEGMKTTNAIVCNFSNAGSPKPTSKE